MPFSIVMLVVIVQPTYVADVHLSNWPLQLAAAGGTIICRRLPLARVKTVNAHGFSFRVGLSVKESNPQRVRVHMVTATVNRNQAHVNKHIILISVRKKIRNDDYS